MKQIETGGSLAKYSESDKIINELHIASNEINMIMILKASTCRVLILIYMIITNIQAIKLKELKVIWII
mgnify:CR=1 FL=1